MIFSTKEFRKKMNTDNIIKILRDGEQSIAELQRRTNMKRSTLIYYIQQLGAEGVITKDRKEYGITGRPTIIKLKKEIIEEWDNKVEAQLKKNIEVLDFISKSKKSIALTNELNDKFPNPQTPLGLISTLTSLVHIGLLESGYKITELGEKFLNKNFAPKD